MRMFDSVSVVLQDIIESGNLTQKSEPNGIYNAMTSVKFIFILHFMIEMLGITDDLCQALQYKLQDILNAMQLVLSTITLLQKFKEHGWDPLIEKVKLFCKDYEIELLNLSAPYKAGREKEMLNMKIQLEHFQLDAHQTMKLQKASTVVELCHVLAKTNKSIIYPLLDRIIHLVLTLPVSTITIERVFSAMKIVKKRLRNRMEDDFFLSTYLVTYIEKEIA
ncbi:hypothetical protein CXB51_028220 [Gossypium anomalum]|uniref:HAT C-terminal dimerisation domain-containing protein n=1 Tax=Gossypium anomalum TaxID=47600 RepID=A0A8J5Y672_9ROSI|nr:hypothetical protein CXB51_028220 [Gossypium anomalum]